MRRVLLVDDEPRVLDGLTRVLRGHFDMTLAVNAQAGIEAIQNDPPFAVVMSDLRMPGMDGIAFLKLVKMRQPDAVRVLLTGYADVTAAIAAVNEGAVFRFLTKPVAPPDLQQALSAAAHQHELITSQRVLLEQTLHGSIRALTDILALVSPAGFGRGIRAKLIVGELAERHCPDERWQIEIAAMLSQVGSIVLPASTVEKLYSGDALSASEMHAVARMPRVAADLVAGIPRLEDVRAILVASDAHASSAAPAASAVPIGARILRIALDFDVLESQGMSAPLAISTLRSRTGVYDQSVLQTLTAVRSIACGERVMEVELGAVQVGMVIATDVKSENGILLIARGQEVTERMVERLRSLLDDVAAQLLVRVTVPAAGAAIAATGARGPRAALRRGDVAAVDPRLARVGQPHTQEAVAPIDHLGQHADLESTE